MGLYEKYILPRFINCACSTKPMMKQRDKVVPRASGTVLEIGIGTGLNLPIYDSSKVEKVIGLDPSQKSWELAGERAAHLETGYLPSSPKFASFNCWGSARRV